MRDWVIPATMENDKGERDINLAVSANTVIVGFVTALVFCMSFLFSHTQEAGHSQALSNIIENQKAILEILRQQEEQDTRLRIIELRNAARDASQ